MRQVPVPKGYGLNPQEAVYEPLKSAPHRREWEVGETRVVAAPGWCIFVDGWMRIDPKRIDDLIEALKEAKRHQNGKNPRGR